MKRTLIFAATFALLAMIYVPGAMHTYQGRSVGGRYRFIFDQHDTSVAFLQLLVNVLFAGGLGALLAQVPKRFLFIGAAVVIVYAGVTSFIAIKENDNANDLYAQRKYGEAAHQAAIWWRAGLRFDQAHEDDTACSRAGRVTALQ
jgi:hypothetical protein